MAVVHHELLRERRFDSMGTEVSILLPAEADDAVDPAVALFAEWDQRFSRFRPDSELSQLNARAGQATEVSESMLAALMAAFDGARATNGVFDPLLANRMVELGYDRTFRQLPTERPAVALGDWQAGRWREVVIDPIRRRVTLPAGSGIDLGGIVKGMAVDAALALLVESGLPFAAVNAGGDLAVHGAPPSMSAWPIAIEVGARERVVTLPSGGLATSSALRRRWRTNGTEQHHLLDPRTGLPARSGVVQASVAAGSCRQAEVAAKVALLAGATAGAEFLEQHRLAGLLLTDDGTEWHVGRWTS
jgi:FAD:protein FMN transferase